MREIEIITEDMIYKDFNRLEIKITIKEDKSSGKSVPILDTDFIIITNKVLSSSQEIESYLYLYGRCVHSNDLEDFEVYDYQKFITHGKLKGIFLYLLYINKHKNLLHQIFEKSFKEEPKLWENYLCNVVLDKEGYKKLTLNWNMEIYKEYFLILVRKDYNYEEKVGQNLIEMYNEYFQRIYKVVLMQI